MAQRMSTNELFEGSATYRIKGLDQYLTLVEAIGPEGVRYYKAWVSDALDGAWTPIANSFERPFAGENNVSFDGDAAWTRDISHGELIREGHDEQMIIDLCGGALQFLYQGQDFEAGNLTSDYSQKPYRLGLLSQGPSDPSIPPLDLPPTPAEPFPTVPVGENLLTNPGFEDGTTGWVVWGGNLSTVSEPIHGGAKAGFVSERTAGWSGAVQNIFAKVEAGTTYFASAWVSVGVDELGAAGASGEPSSQPVALTMMSMCGTASTYTNIASGQVEPGEWVELHGTLDVPTCADLSDLVIYVEGPAAGVDLYVDDASLSE